MTDPYRKVRAGDQITIPARAWNTLMDVARESASSRGAILTPGPTPTPVGVSVKNGSGADLPRFGVLAIDGPIIDPASRPDGFLEQIIVDGVAVAADNLSGFVIAVEPIESSRYGEAVIAGPLAATITVNSEAHKYATPVAGSSVIESSTVGPIRILWVESGTGAGKHAILHVTGETQAGEVAVMITSSSPIPGEDNRWRYSWIEVGDDIDCTPIVGGLISSSDGYAYNTVETNNSSSGTQGSGISLANLPAGWEMKPIGNGAVVYIKGPFIQDDDSAIWRFSVTSSEDGTCAT